MVGGRKRHRYIVQIQRADTGQIQEREFLCYWGPDKDFVLGGVMAAAAGEAAIETRDPQGRCIPHAGLSAVYRGVEGAEEVVEADSTTVAA